MKIEKIAHMNIYLTLALRDPDFNPLGLVPTDSACVAAFKPDHPALARIAVTEMDTAYRHIKIHGIVHDENACALGGVAGHAGLFSSARDAAVLSQMMLNGGVYKEGRPLQPTTIRPWTPPQTIKNSPRPGSGTPRENPNARALL